jgi:hypothetical protein
VTLAVAEMMNGNSAAGFTFCQIADKLNDLGLHTLKGSICYPCAVNKAIAISARILDPLITL